MRAFGRFLFTFNGLLWAFTFLAALALVAYPLARNLYASYTWDKVPCWYSAATHTWYFDRDGTRYTTDVPDFWSGFIVPAQMPRVPQNFARPFDDYCYVSHSQPYEAVHRLDAHKNLEGALPQLIRLSVLLCVVTILTVVSRRLKHNPQPARG